MIILDHNFLKELTSLLYNKKDHNPIPINY